MKTSGTVRWTAWTGPARQGGIFQKKARRKSFEFCLKQHKSLLVISSSVPIQRCISDLLLLCLFFLLLLWCHFTSYVMSVSFSELFPELFHVISDHLPLAYRPSTLLSLALTCHRLHEVVIPHLLYKDVRLVGEGQALPTLNTLIAKVELAKKEDIQKKGNLSPSHCIHHLCIDSSIKTPIRTPDHSINALRKLVDVDGLPYLSALTLHVNGGIGMAHLWAMPLTFTSCFLCRSCKA